MLKHPKGPSGRMAGPPLCGKSSTYVYLQMVWLVCLRGLWVLVWEEVPRSRPRRAALQSETLAPVGPGAKGELKKTCRPGPF